VEVPEVRYGPDGLLPIPRDAKVEPVAPPSTSPRWSRRAAGSAASR